METSTRKVETFTRQTETDTRKVVTSSRQMETSTRKVETSSRQVETSTRKKFKNDHNTLIDNIVVSFGQNQAQTKESHPNFLHICLFSNALTTQKKAKEQESNRTCYPTNHTRQAKPDNQYPKDGTTANIGFMKLKKGGLNRLILKGLRETPFF